MHLISVHLPSRATSAVIAFAIIALTGCGGGGSATSNTNTITNTNTNTNSNTNAGTTTSITAKSSSLNTGVGTTTSTRTSALSGTGTSASTAGVGCDASGTGTTVTGVVDSNNTSRITTPVSTSYTYSWTCSSTTRTLSANAIPNHAVGVFPNTGNPNTISVQTVSASMKLAPTLASATNYNAQVTAFGLNGIKFDANTGGGCPTSAAAVSSCSYIGGGTWSLEALVSVTPFDFGADTNLAHVQPTGDYHYHGAPARLYLALGGTLDGSGVPTKMVLIGWAMDGYPLYYKVGYATATDATSSLRALKGNYLPNSSATTSSTRPTSSVFPLGTFKNDWAYSASNGGDLDECNGRTGVTPEFPSGIYYYVVTDSYPFAPRCLKGTT